MDVILVGIAGLSLVLAIAMGVMLFKLLREERRRSDARVALLVAAAARQETSLPLHAAKRPAPAPRPVSLHADLFSTADTPSPWRQRAVAAAVVAVVVLAAGYVLLPRGHESAAVVRAAQVMPLELLALRHTQDADGLTISGVVHNPRNGAQVARVVATALLFGSDGTQLAIGRAQLDYTTLAPGDESPFVVKVPVTGAVARYRVGFRGPDGSVIAHVDRREGATARNGQTTGITP